MKNDEPLQLNFPLDVIGEYEIRREVMAHGQGRSQHWSWWYWVYRDGRRVIKFLKQETAVAYVRDRHGFSGPQGRSGEKETIPAAAKEPWSYDGFGEREIPF